MNNKILILILILVIIGLYFLYEDQENLDSTSTTQNLSNEAIQNIASIYNNQNMTVTNLTATNQANIKDAKMSGNLNVSGSITGNVTGKLTSPNGKYSLNISDDGKITLYNDSNKTDIVIDGDLLIQGSGNTTNNRVRIGLNKNGDGATSTKTNLGIFNEDKTNNTIGKLQVNNFELGRKRVNDSATEGMLQERNYDYIRSNLKSSAFNNKDHTGLFNMMWNNGHLYWTYLYNNNRWGNHIGFLPSSDFDS
jgi:hypothetical protein